MLLWSGFWEQLNAGIKDGFQAEESLLFAWNVTKVISQLKQGISKKDGDDTLLYHDHKRKNDFCGILRLCYNIKPILFFSYSGFSFYIWMRPQPICWCFLDPTVLCALHGCPWHPHSTAIKESVYTWRIFLVIHEGSSPPISLLQERVIFLHASLKLLILELKCVACSWDETKSVTFNYWLLFPLSLSHAGFWRVVFRTSDGQALT